MALKLEIKFIVSSISFILGWEIIIFHSMWECLRRWFFSQDRNVMLNFQRAMKISKVFAGYWKAFTRLPLNTTLKTLLKSLSDYGKPMTVFTPKTWANAVWCLNGNHNSNNWYLKRKNVPRLGPEVHSTRPLTLSPRSILDVWPLSADGFLWFLQLY